MFTPSKRRLLVLPAGIFLTLVFALLSEMADTPILVPLSLLPLIFSLVYVSPLFAYAAAWCYEKAFQKNIQGTLVAASLRYRSQSIGLSVVLLFCVCVVSTVTVGLTNAGLGQLGSGLSFWKPGMHWGAIREDVNIYEKYSDLVKPGVLGTYAQVRLKDDRWNSVNVFIMPCFDYAATSADNPVCPADETESILVPEGFDKDLTKLHIFVPFERTELKLPPLRLQEVPGLTEVLISTTNPELNAIDRNLYVDLEKLPAESVMSIIQDTRNGVTSQERINYVDAERNVGYLNMAIFLVAAILIFGLAAICGITVAAVRDRKELASVLLLRGVKDTVVKTLIRIEVVCLILPFVLAGCLGGVIFAAAIAQVSSLEAADAITYHSLVIFLIYLCAIPVITELQLRTIGKNND